MITILNHNKLILSIIIILLFSVAFTTNAAEEPCWKNLKNESVQEIKQNPKDIKANYNHIISLVNLGEIKRAYKTIDKFEKDFNENDFIKQISPYFQELCKYPDNILLLNYTAFYGVVIQEYDIAIKYFQRILKLTPNNYNIRNFLSASYYELEKFDLALKEANKALKSKDNEFSHLLLGAIHYKNGNVLKAVSEFSKSGSLGREILNNN
ncbi:MAG TPA: hypothetical protein VKN64_05005 [Halanaerobiales bacterium]|nr:hypothetical protein [Halanaerobiales bacterium]